MEWKFSDKPVAYEEALRFMDERAAGIHDGTLPECVWLLEHPSIYTAGTSAKEQDLLRSDFPVYETGRGGQYTYHGPGQRVAYVMVDLKKRGGDIRKYVCNLEEWIIKTLAEFGIEGERRSGRIGIWIKEPEAKIAALGVRVRRGVTMHGIAINVDPDLSHFEGIVPCGIAEYGVTSMRNVLKKDIDRMFLDARLKETFHKVFG